MDSVKTFRVKKILNKYVLLTTLFLVIILLLLYCFKDNIFRKSDYVYLKDRQACMVQAADINYLDEYYGNENTMVVFSASWCKYCVEEQDELNNFIKNNPEKKVIIVSHDKTYEDLDKYLKDNNFNWFVIFDKDKTIREHIDPGSTGIPCAYLLDKNGKIIGFNKGAMTETEFLQFYNNEAYIY